VEKDQGMYDAINRGLLKASGDILAHLNCDEQYLPGTLEAVADYFEGHPRTDIVFADAIVVDHRGEYICHRKVISPSKYHTWLCHLGTLTCGTFFRRKLIDEQKLFFDTRWRVIGDAYWILQILERRVPMGVLRRFASSFTDHDTNLSLEPLAAKEAKDLIRSAPGWAQKLRKLFVLQHRMRRALSGIYRQAPFTYSIYTEQSPDTRVLHTVSKPTFLWRSRL
jgi:glycosyltransferase involved in cell wall biosynthesis